MLIQALCDYGDMQESRHDVQKLPEGFSEQPVHFHVLLKSDGSIADIIEACPSSENDSKKGKKTLQSRLAVLPERTQKTGICSNLIEHRPLYIFGLNLDKGVFTANDKTNKAKKSHAAFVEKNLEFFEDLDTPICNAYCNFIRNWVPENETENPHLLQLGRQYAGAYFSFGLEGYPGKRLEQDAEFLEKYATFCRVQKEEKKTAETECAVCGVLGETLPMARIHDKIKFPGGNPTGCVLVGMKEPAFASYGKKQSYNSNISEKAMKKYTATLNQLLSDKNHYIVLDDLVLVYFAMKENDQEECTLFSWMMDPGEEKAARTEASLNTIFQAMKNGEVKNLESVQVNPNVMFYVAGLTPNSSRICQKFIYRNQFGTMLKNLVQHQDDLRVAETKRQVSFSAIKSQLVSPVTAHGKVPPPLMTNLLLAALNGTKYPDALLETVVRRVKTDSDEEEKPYLKLNSIRAGIIKACLNRSARRNGKKEEIKMALDLENKNPAYLCGRLFAVLEEIQQKASGGKLNRTIKDTYFSSACANPSLIFPKLIQLAQNHLRNLSDESDYQGKIGEIIDGLSDAFPQTLDLEAQGRFIIGYYHQNRAFYNHEKKESEVNE